MLLFLDFVFSELSKFSNSFLFLVLTTTIFWKVHKQKLQWWKYKSKYRDTKFSFPYPNKMQMCFISSIFLSPKKLQKCTV